MAQKLNARAILGTTFFAFIVLIAGVVTHGASGMHVAGILASAGASYAAAVLAAETIVGLIADGAAWLAALEFPVIAPFLVAVAVWINEAGAAYAIGV